MRAGAETIFDAVGRGTVHPFPARMAPNIALRAITSKAQRLRILDPMMGSGTVLAVARAQGHEAVGADLDPLAVLISRVWTTPINRQEAIRRAKLVLKKAKARFKNIPARHAYPYRADEETKEFARYWFDLYSRKQLSALAETITRVRSTEIREVLWCAFSRLIITKQAGASLAMDLSHSRPHKRFETAPAKPFAHFLRAVEKVVESTIDITRRRRGPAAKIYQADARRLPIRSKSVDLVLTSPPYLNAIDYIRCSKFSLIWMGYSIYHLRQLRGESIGTEIGAKEQHAGSDLIKIMDELNVRSNLSNRDRSILLRYICDMKVAMAEVARVLAPSGTAVYVVGENTVRGTYIRTSRILAAVAKQVGLNLVSQRARTLPASRRYLPPPRRTMDNRIDLRMRREVIITFYKPTHRLRV